MNRAVYVTSSVLVALSSTAAVIPEGPTHARSPIVSRDIQGNSYQQLFSRPLSKKPVHITSTTFYAMNSERIVKIVNTHVEGVQSRKFRPQIAFVQPMSNRESVNLSMNVTKLHQRAQQPIQPPHTKAPQPQPTVMHLTHVSRSSTLNKPSGTSTSDNTSSTSTLSYTSNASNSSNTSKSANTSNASNSANTSSRVGTAKTLGLSAAKDALAYLGRPYQWGGESPEGFDCSGLVQYVYTSLGVQMPRTSYEQFDVGTPISWDDLRPGDLVFFTTDEPGASHVAIYIGNGLIVQALNPDTGVIVSHLDDDYYREHFIGARRPC